MHAWHRDSNSSIELRTVEHVTFCCVASLPDEQQRLVQLGISGLLMVKQ